MNGFMDADAFIRCSQHENDFHRMQMFLYAAASIKNDFYRI